MGVHATVVETGIHYPTDSTLVHDGLRVLTRVMKKVRAVAEAVVTPLLDRTRSVKRRVPEIVRASRHMSEKGQQKLTAAYRKLLEVSSRVVGQAKGFSAELACKRRAVLRRARQKLNEMIPRVQQVMHQTRLRVLGGEMDIDRREGFA
jgi:IS5 family transposase